MSTARALRWTVLLGLVVTPAAVAQQPAATRTARVTYLSSSGLFIDAGSVEGLRVGHQVEVVRRGRAVAVLRVESLGEHQASCVVVRSQSRPVVGDAVRFTPAEPRTATSPVVAAPPPVRDPPPPRDSITPAAPTRAPVRPVHAAPAAISPLAQQTARAPTGTDSSAPARPEPPPRRTTASGQAADTSTATVTFLSGGEIYVGAGRQAGLLEGAELVVVRRDSVISTLRVKYVASQQSSCDVIRGGTDIVVGDVVRFVARVPAAETRAAETVARRRGPRRLSGPGIHGRIGTRYLHATAATVAPGTETANTGFNQPSFDVRANGLDIGGTPIGLALDLRTRRTVTSSTGQPNRVDGRTRVYQAAVFWGGPGARFRAVAGRQYLTAVTSVSLFDGGLIEINGSHASLGAFGGFEPDAMTLDLSPDIRDVGGYVQLHNRPRTAAAWSFTVGAVRSHEAGQSNREFAFMQASVNNRSFSFYGLQEVDYYPPWKVALGEQQFSFTSQYANVLMRPSRWVSVGGFYDNRRSVRLYRDTQNPETAFDDAYRQGYGGGLQLTGGTARLGGDWRRSTGGTAGGADSYTGTIGLDQITPLKLAVSARATWYQNQNDSTLNNPGAERTHGQLYSWQLGFGLAGGVRIDFNGGLRREDNPNTATMQRSSWYGVDMDVSVARAWFVSLSGLQQKDPANPGTSTTTQLYSSVTWRF